MIRAGQRTKRMEIQTRVTTGSVITWTTRASRWARLEMLSGTEGIEARKLMAGRIGRATFAYDAVTALIKPIDRLQLGTRVFQIESAINVEERNRDIEVTVVEQV